MKWGKVVWSIIRVDVRLRKGPVLFGTDPRLNPWFAYIRNITSGAIFRLQTGRQSRDLFGR